MVNLQNLHSADQILIDILMIYYKSKFQKSKIENRLY